MPCESLVRIECLMLVSSALVTGVLLVVRLVFFLYCWAKSLCLLAFTCIVCCSTLEAGSDRASDR
jgi:hypothetical protein